MTSTPAYDHIVVVVEENHAVGQIIGNPEAPFLNQVAAKGVQLANYYAITHPSQPNYFALYAGSTFGVADDGNHLEPDPTLASILQASGKSFVGYIESGSPQKHNPWESFPEGVSVERNFSAFPTSDFSRLPNVAFVIPNLDDDEHDGTIGQSDQWLRDNIKSYANWATTHNSLLVITWDEDDGGGATNQIPTMLYGANINPGSDGTLYTHYDLLHTLLDASHLGAPNNAANAPGIGSRDFLPATTLDSSDFNGDHRADVFLHNQNGTAELLQMNGGQTLSDSIIGSVGPEWDVQSAADFNGDGRGDILWRAADGKVALWTMNGPQIQSSQTVGAVGNEWHLQDTGDLNGDGRADIVWRSDSGVLAVWTMNGGQIASNTSLGVVGTDWHVVALADFDGDHKSDILWRSDGGVVALWQMNGNQVAANTGLGTIGKEWTIAGAGDFNGDGKADILWRANDGTIALWQMDGAHVVANQVVGAIGSEWQLSAIGDFSGDGKADILWHQSDGTTALWTMDGAHVVSQQIVTSITGSIAAGAHHYDLV